DFCVFLEFVRKSDSVGDTHLGSEVRNHPDNLVFLGSEVERTIAAFGKPVGLSLPLREESVQRNIASCQYPQITVHWKDVFVFVKNSGHTHRNRFLTDA